MINLKTELTLPAVGLTGFEAPLNETELAIQDTLHRFAKDVLRPAGQELDKMTAEQVIAPGSPYYEVLAKASQLGLDSSLLEQMPPETAIRVESIIGEEMGWGDAGLGVSLACVTFPLEMAKAVGNSELVDLCRDKIGCWMITHPDKGSDVQIFDMAREWPVKGGQGNKGNVWGVVGKDEIVINGQCSAWVSNGVVAQVALAYIGADYGDGFFDANGRSNGVALIIPLDLPGVSKGKPLDKIGRHRAAPGRDLFRQRPRSQAFRDRAQGRVLRQPGFGVGLRGVPHGPAHDRIGARGLRDGAAILPRAQAGWPIADRSPAHALAAGRHAASG